MKKEPHSHFGVSSILIFISLVLLFVTPEPYYKTAREISWYFMIPGIGLSCFDMIRSIIYKRQNLSKKRTTETIDERKKREKERSHDVILYGIILGILYILYITGMLPE